MPANRGSLRVSEWDVVIIGGGPSGATVAAILARRGWRCLVLETHTFPRYHVGESLLPSTNRVFAEMEVLPVIRAAQFRRKQGVRFVSREGSASVPFYYSEVMSPGESETWHVERAKFDRLLLDHAMASGAVVRESAHVERVLFEDGRAVGLEGSREQGGRLEVRARVVVDASGRACLLGRQLGLIAEVPGIRKACAWAYYRGLRLPDGFEDNETGYFLLPGGGWAWCIPLPAGVFSLGIVDDADTFNRAAPTPEVAYLNALQRSETLREAVHPATRVGRCRCLTKIAYQNRQTAGEGWMLVGDARCFLDPIYSLGLTLAIHSAALAAESAHEALEAGEPCDTRLARREPHIQLGFQNAARLIDAFYHPRFNMLEFLNRFPDLRHPLVRAMAGDLFCDHTPLLRGFAEICSPHAPLLSTAAFPE
jgi:flavin-dependent dehydrogenase